MESLAKQSDERVFILPSHKAKRFLRDASRRGLKPTRPVRIDRKGRARYAVVLLPRQAA